MARQLVVFVIAAVCSICLLSSTQGESIPHLGEEVWTHLVGTAPLTTTLVDGEDNQEQDNEEESEAEVLAAPLDVPNGLLALNHERRLPLGEPRLSEGRHLLSLLFRPPRR